jgi:hypothetical protein
LPPGVFVSAVCALPQLVDIAAPGQPGGQLPLGVTVSRVGKHARHEYITVMAGWPDHTGTALLGSDELAELIEPVMSCQPSCQLVQSVSTVSRSNIVRLALPGPASAHPMGNTIRLVTDVRPARRWHADGTSRLRWVFTLLG